MPVDFSIELRLSYLRAAMAAQEETEDAIALRRDFYDGEQQAYTTDRQEEYLLQDVDSFANIMKRIVAVPKDRLEISEDGVRPGDEQSAAYAELATDWWKANNLHAKQKDVYEAALRDGQTAIIVDYDPTRRIPTFTPNLVYDGGSGLVRFHYDADDNLLFASKRWTTWNPIGPGETGKRRMTVYRPDLIERYEADRNTPGGWRFLDPAEIGMDNPQIWTDNGRADGEPIGIPVIPFENSPNAQSEITNDLITIQEMLNHNVATFDIVVDYHGFPMLWMSNVDLPVDSSTGKSTIPAFGPGQAIRLNADGQLGRLENANLQSLYESSILAWLHLIGHLKGWPPHLINLSSQPPSGVALQVLEGSLVSQIKDKQAVFGGAWKDAFEIARKINRLNGGPELSGELEFMWESPKVNDELSEAEAMSKRFEAAQYPLISRWRLMGHTDDEIEQFIEDKQREDEFGLIDFQTGIEQ